MAVNLEHIISAMLGGILPAVIWLWFWLREDKRHPEPRGVILRIFLLGGLTVPIAYFLERWLTRSTGFDLETNLMLVVLIWAGIEEILKLLAVEIAGFRHRDYDEPVDAMIYMITAALGFAALENVLFILNDLYGSSGATGLSFLITGNFRFIGPTLLHIVASAVLGGFIALAFCKDKVQQRVHLTLGLVTATLLHALFNYFIITSDDGARLNVFIILWAVAIFVIFFFEKIKDIVCKFTIKHN